jgi:hypothetical protein
VCYLDITDWPGGQMTASAVPAFDFGPENSRPANLPRSLTSFLWGPDMANGTNLGNCWVSFKCFTPDLALRDFALPLLARFDNLRVSLSTAVSSVQRSAARGSGVVTGLRAVRRTPAAGGGGAWAVNTSEMLADWYDPSPSARFDKEVLDIAIAPFGVLIEATEFGDALATSGVPFAQGIEVPDESSRSYLSSCGQGTTVPHYTTYGREPAPSPDPWPAGSRGGGAPFDQQGLSWQRDWTYRRVDAARGSDPNKAAPGETSVINVGGGDDYDSGYIFYAINSSELNAQLAAPGLWRGGVNLTAYAMAEQRSFGFYHYFRANASADISPVLALNASLAGTLTGLAKM